MNNEAGGSVYPHESHLSHRGISLRDRLAEKAMEILLEAALSPTWEIKNETTWVDDLASDSYRFADAMLKARNG